MGLDEEEDVSRLLPFSVGDGVGTLLGWKLHRIESNALKVVIPSPSRPCSIRVHTHVLHVLHYG